MTSFAGAVATSLPASGSRSLGGSPSRPIQQGPKNILACATAPTVGVIQGAFAQKRGKEEKDRHLSSFSRYGRETGFPDQSWRSSVFTEPQIHSSVCPYPPCRCDPRSICSPVFLGCVSNGKLRGSTHATVGHGSKSGSGTVAGTARGVLRTTVPDPFFEPCQQSQSLERIESRQPWPNRRERLRKPITANVQPAAKPASQSGERSRLSTSRAGWLAATSVAKLF